MAENRDVYISFNRWEDTVRYSFVSHLSAAFHRRGISSFAGEDCYDPESNGFSMLSGSRVCVVVFSNKYLSSKQCLVELLKVYERGRNNNLAVVPVFYTVTRSYVKKKIWSLVDDRSALLEIAYLPGHESYHKLSDSDFVQEIVADVCEKLNVSENIGIYSRLLRVENLICKQPWGVRRIGIWGMAGIGKTTLAQAIFDQMSGDYEASFFIKDFNNEFRGRGLYSLLEQHFGKILKEELGKSNTYNSIIRPGLVRNVLRHKTVLVILDDVHKPLDAESFLGGFDWFNPGSLIVITSRDKQVFPLCRITCIYEVPSFNEKEAQQLFSRCVFGEGIKHDESLQKLSAEVIDYASGNPLALAYTGKTWMKNPKEIESAFLTLKESPPLEIHDAIKSTYDSLSSNEKDIFLDIACLLNGENLNVVMDLLEGCVFFPRVGINVLVEKCLVSITSEGRVVMHNLIQCIARKIINGRHRRSRLWEPSRIKPFLEKERVLGGEAIEAIYLDPYVLNIDVNPMAFEKMYNLRYLKITSSILRNNQALLHLPKGVKSLPEELRLLHWENFQSLILPHDFNPRNLVTLDMCYSQLQKLWEGTKKLEMLKRIRLCHSHRLVDIQELQDAQNVEEIDLQDCPRLERFLATSHFQHLRVINLSGCKKIKIFPEVPPSIEELYLKQTGIRSIPFVTLSPQDNSFTYHHGDHNLSNRRDSLDSQCMSVMVCLEYLKVLDLSHCTELEDVEDIPKSLRKLYLGGTGIEELPSLAHLSQLTVLDLENCKNLRELPRCIGNLNSLAVLNLTGCLELEVIQDIPKNLKELYLAGTAIQEVPSSIIKNLSELVILDLQNCKRLHHLPLEISDLKSLVTLKLSDPSGMSMREISTSEFGVERLLLSFNENSDQRRHKDLPRTRLPSSSLYFLAPRFYALVSLSLYNASLMHIPQEICSLPSVTMLDLSRNGFSEIPESIKLLSKLHSLRLRHCKNLVSLPELPQGLKLLNLHGCVSLESVLPRFEQLPSRYTFRDCSMKSPEVARKRVVKGLAKVASIGKEDQQELIKALAFSIYAPADANQTSSYNLRTGSFATVELTSSLRNTLLGFAIFVVVTFSDDIHNNAGLGIRCISTWKTKKRVSSRMEKVLTCWAPREAPKVHRRDHMFVFYQPAERHRGSGEGNEPRILADHIEFQFQAVSAKNKVLGGSCMVTECDVSIITAATGAAASLRVISASKDMSLRKKDSPKLSGLLSKLRFRHVGSIVGCVCF